MRGDELDKLHNIFIRYYFTCLVDGLQGDTLKTNVEPRGEKRSVVNTGLRRRNTELPNQMNNNWCVFWLYKCDQNKALRQSRGLTVEPTAPVIEHIKDIYK